MQHTGKDTTGYLMRRLWRDWMRKHLPRIIVAVSLMLVVAAASAAYPKLIETSINMLEAKNQDVIWMMPVAIILVTFFKGLAAYGQSVLAQSVALRVINELQKAMFAHLMRADMRTHHLNSTGKLISAKRHGGSDSQSRTGLFRRPSDQVLPDGKLRTRARR